MRTPNSRNGLVAVLAAVATAGAAGCDGGAADGKQMPTLGTQFAKPTPSESPTESSAPEKPRSLPAFDDKPRWTFTPPGSGTPADIEVIGSGFVVLGEEHVHGLDKRGEEKWSHRVPGDGPEAYEVVGDVVVVGAERVSEDEWPGRIPLTAYDAGSGAKLWQDDQSSFVSADDEGLYLAECTGRQNAQRGDCTLSARDPRSGSVRWTIPTFHAPEVSGAADGAALITSHPGDGKDNELAAVDRTTGSPLGLRLPVPRDFFAVGDTLVAVEEDDDNPANGCTIPLAGYDIASGVRRWQRDVSVAKDDDRRRCVVPQEAAVGDGKIAVGGGKRKPMVLDVQSGRVVWTAPVKGSAVAATGDGMLVDTGSELHYYRQGGAKPRWTAALGGDPVFDRVGDRLIDALYDTVVVDLRSGEAGKVEAERSYVGNDWFALCTEEECSGYRG